MNKYISKIKKYLLLEIFFDILCTVLASTVPLLQKWLFDFGLYVGISKVFFILAVYIIIQILRVVFTYFCMLFSWKSGIRFERLLKQSFLQSVFSLKHKNFYEKPIGDYISLQGNDITALEQDYLAPSVNIIRSINMIIVYGIVMFIWVDWRVSVTILICSIITAVGPKLMSNIVSSRRNEYQQQMANYITKITDLLEGFKLINLLTRKNINRVHDKILEETAEKRYKYGKAKSLALSLNDLAIKIIQVAAFTAAAILLVNGDISIGVAVATFGYVESFLSPINDILYDITAIQSVKKIKQRFLDYVNSNPKGNLIQKDNFIKNISFKNIEYKYDNFSIKNLSFNFEKGKKYAIIGYSGSGKSTILKLIMGYLTPVSGDILIDNDSVSQIDISNIISYIDQSEHIFRDKYIENAGVYGSYTLEKVYDLINIFGKKLFDIFHAIKNAANCQDLSGGEKQALLFLRLAAKNSLILLLDESFSALDLGSRDLFENYLFNDKNMKEKTIISITHDLRENLNRYDEILLMKDGSLIAHDKFENLKNLVEYKLLQGNLNAFI